MKGADSVILERLAKGSSDHYINRTNQLLELFSFQGLRTLCYALKIYSEEEFASIEKKMREFNEMPNKDEMIDFFVSSIERNFQLLGCTAVEDKLQDKVPEVIADLISAKIKVWMLTGDKKETAENIAFSCKLIQQDFQKYYLLASDVLESKCSEIEAALSQKQQKVSLILEGPLVNRIIANPILANKVVSKIFSKCDSVVCFRMSPNDKGGVVSLVKDYRQRVTLAIGDGANDVNMIKRAHIGVGLYGQEGLRAAQSGDYALVNFKSLWKLLFVHGHWSYIRISEMILYFYYKNTIFTFVQFLFCLENAYSGQTLFDSYYITFFNLFFTSWPLLIRATFDNDIHYKKWSHVGQTNSKFLTEDFLIKQFYPYLYYIGQKNKSFK